MRHHVTYVISSRPDRQYFEMWLRRTGRQLAVSGRISQLATLLAQENEGTFEQWCGQLREIMQGTETPSIEILTRIDALLATPSPTSKPAAYQTSLF